MPQMAPLNWLILYIFFMVIFMMFSFMNYYSFIYTPKSTLYINKKNHINWKW